MTIDEIIIIRDEDESSNGERIVKFKTIIKFRNGKQQIASLETLLEAIEYIKMEI